MYEIYLIRHAIAEERGTAWPDDDLRPLTGEGVRRFREVVRGLVALDVELDVLLTSPLTRALQTAGLVSAGLQSSPGHKILKALAPGTPPAAVVSKILAVPDWRRLAVVGHEPDLGELASFLAGAKRPFAFKKGGVCRIDLPSRTAHAGGDLIWFAPPALLRRLGRL